MKNAKKYIQLYEEKAEGCFKKYGYYYPPKTWEDLYDWDNDSYEKYLKEKEDGAVKTRTYLSLLNTTEKFGFYLAFQKPDYELLNNVLFQTSRQELLDNSTLASGGDHCNVLLDVTNAFACNDFDIIDHFFPKNLPHSKGRFYTEVSVNLLKVLYYKEYELKAEALQKAEIFLSKKTTNWIKYVVLYFVALTNQDAEKASEYLQELCLAYQKIGYPKNKLDKCFASEVHGMYRFARLIDEALFNKIQRPKHPAFFEEFELWQTENNYPKGKMFYKYPEKMDYMNKIFEAELPTVELYTPYPNKRIISKNVEKFAADLTENIKRIK